MKRWLPWVFPPVILVFCILSATHTGPVNLWSGVAAGLVLLWMFYLVASGRLGSAGRR